MTLKEMNETVFKGKLSLVGLERMRDSNVLPYLYDVPLNDAETFRIRLLQWKSTFVGRFVFKYPRYYGFIARLHSVFGHTPEWSDFTKQGIDDVVEHFSSCAKSSAKTYLTMLRTILSDASDEVTLPYPKFAERMKVKGTPSVNVYLNMNDLKKLEAYIAVNEKEKIILAQFLVGCYTGARHSDIVNMTVENLSDGYLNYVSQKTKVQTTVEAKPILYELLPEAGKRIYSDSVFNDTIRDICRKAGIDEKIKIFRRGKCEIGEKWQFIASHTARRSFATNLAELDVPIIQIAKRMGHTDIKTTFRYLMCPISKLEGNAKYFFR